MENQDLTQNEETIRQQMEETREALTEKVETLEKKIVGSVQDASAAVSGAMSSVKETVAESVESVKDAMDVKAHVENHPWLMLGGAVICGYVLGSLLSRQRSTQPPQQAAAKPHQAHGNGHHKRAKAKEVPPEAPSWLAAFEPELRQLKALALGMTLGTVREIVAAEVPPHAAEELRSVIDGITKKVGGEPMPSSDWDALTQKSAALTQEEERGISHESWHEPRW